MTARGARRRCRVRRDRPTASARAPARRSGHRAACCGPPRWACGRSSWSAPWPGALVLLHPGHLLRAFAEWPCAPHHQVAGHAAAALGGLALAASLVWALARVAQAAFAVRRLVRAPLGRGPEGSVIVGGDDVVLAAAGLARPTLVVSAGALARLDDAELAAAIAHERAHIRRRHRYVLLYAELCRVLGRPLPGTARAVRQLRFHIERDADRSAVRERADRLALASAICKAATGATTRAGMAALGGDGTAARVRELLQDAVRRRRRPRPARARGRRGGVRGGRRAVAAGDRRRARRSGRALRRVVVRVASAALRGATASSRGGRPERRASSVARSRGRVPGCRRGLPDLTGVGRRSSRSARTSVIPSVRGRRRRPRGGRAPATAHSLPSMRLFAPRSDRKRRRTTQRRRPPTPALDRDRDDRARAARAAAYWRYLATSAARAASCSSPSVEHGGGAVDAHPPQRVPVLLVVVDEQARPRVGADVVQALQPRAWPSAWRRPPSTGDRPAGRSSRRRRAGARRAARWPGGRRAPPTGARGERASSISGGARRAPRSARGAAGSRRRRRGGSMSSTRSTPAAAIFSSFSSSASRRPK